MSEHSPPDDGADSYRTPTREDMRQERERFLVQLLTANG